MAEHRFILNAPYQVGSIIDLSKADLHHAHTLRLKTKDMVLVVDQKGVEFQGEIEIINKQQVQIRLIAKTNRASESTLNLTLFQGLTKGTKLDLVIQKTTELGVCKIVPMVTTFSQIKIHPERDQKIQRWQEIARQATRQSGRLNVPEIASPQSFENCLDSCVDQELTVLFHNISSNQIKIWDNLVKSYDHQALHNINLFVGPEGGFSEQEIGLAEQKGCQIIKLGPRVLRAETAGIVAVTLAQSSWGDLS